MGADVITKEDLEIFRVRLMGDIREILTAHPSEPKEWLKSMEVRKILKISNGTLQNLRIAGKLYYSKIGGIYYYRYPEIMSLLEAGKNTF